MRIRITFAKTSDMRYTGHLDLHRAWERLIRRARLPLAYTQGFSPHPRINLASALPLGFTGEAEVVDIWLEQELPLDKILTALRQAAPPGIGIEQIETIDDHSHTLQTILEASEYVITLLEPVANLEARRVELLTAKEIIRQRRGRAYDLRPLILDLQSLPKDGETRQRLLACLVAHEGATGRPEEVLEALGIDPLTARVHRNRLIFRRDI
jgi:radical SAM-linked protein